MKASSHFVYVLLVAALVPTAAAQAVTLSHDNDEFFGSDKEYAAGTRLIVVDRSTPSAGVLNDRLPVAKPTQLREELSRGWSIAHGLYVPTNIAASAPLPAQRPYAAWLQISGISVVDDTDSRSVGQLGAGIVGPEALGEPLVKFFHNAFDGRPMRGWEYQIPTYIFAEASWERRWRNIDCQFTFACVDSSPYIGLRVGTARVDVEGGMMIRIGDVGNDFGDMHISHVRTGGRASSTGLTGYLFGYANARIVAHDVFLDRQGRGGSGRETSLTPVQFESGAGVTLEAGSLEFTLAAIVESQRYDEQVDVHRYGRVQVRIAY